MQPAEGHALSQWKRAAGLLSNFQGFCNREFLRPLPARFRPIYATILPRNYFTLKKKSPPAPRNMPLTAMQDSNRILLKEIAIKLKRFDN